MLVDLPVGSTHVGENEVRQRDLRKMFQRHEETLHNHTEQLEETCTKIETIREMLDDKKGMCRGINADLPDSLCYIL